MAAAQKMQALVDRIVDHGGRAYTVFLRPERLIPRFLAGQFLHLALDDYEPSGFWPESRVFSIASSPAVRDQIRLTYSVQGAFTDRMERELATGERVWIKLPYGDFVIDASHQAVLFAGGTGITAFTAFLEGLKSTSRPVTLAYGARSEALLVYHDVIDRCAERVDSFRPMYFVEAAETVGAKGTVPMLPGRVSVAEVWPRLPEPTGSQFYISGPPLMIQTIRTALYERHVQPEAIHVDAWE